MSALKTKEITEDIKEFLTDKAMEALSLPKITTLTGTIDGETYIVKYLGIITKTRVLGAMGISQIINNIVNEHRVLGVLAPPLQMQLGGVDLSPLKFATVVYLAFDQKGSEEIDRHLFSIQEGGYPKGEFEETPEIVEAIKQSGLKNLDEEPI